MQEGPRRIHIPIDLFVKRSWPLLAVGAVLVLIASGVLLWVAVSGVGRKPVATASQQVASAAATSTILVPRALDGVLVSAEDANLLPYAVMIDNHPDARPSSGLAAANLVFEVPVEGGMTRYLAVYDATTTVDQIGPVRSARPYFVELADALGAVYAHVGGSPEGLNLITALPKFRDLNEYWNGKYFWRSAKRDAPHNVYTRTDLLHAAADAKSWSTGLLRGWRFKDEDPMENATGTSRGRLAGPTIPSGGVVVVAWTYDRTANAYSRYLDGRPHVELDGAQVRAKNVVVLLTDAEVKDAEGRLKLRTIGRGDALLYRDGKKFTLTWRRTSGGLYQFETVDGSDATFNRGTTWVEIVTSKTAFGS